MKKLQPPQLHELVKIKSNKTPMDRKCIFTFLQYYQFMTPDVGLVKELFQRHDMKIDCVVYMDNGSSEKMRLVDAIQKHPDNYASLYVGHKGQIACSTRMIQLGAMSYWFDFTSTDWRSNYGDFECEFVSTSPGYHPKIDLPCFSIDFVRLDLIYAIDFDLIPGAKKTTLNEIISHKQAVKQIRDGIKHYEK